MSKFDKQMILVCNECSIEYLKPVQFKIWNDEKPNVFFKMSLEYCDTCRKIKEFKALQSLASVLVQLNNPNKKATV